MSDNLDKYVNDYGFYEDYSAPTSSLYTFTQPEMSEWVCYMFGAQDGWGFLFQPPKGKEPNWFWRKMQFLCFGHKWIKK